MLFSFLFLKCCFEGFHYGWLFLSCKWLLTIGMGVRKSCNLQLMNSLSFFFFNPISIWLKYSIIVLEGGKFNHVCVLTSLLAKKKFLQILNWNFRYLSCHITKAVSNREICFIKAVLLLCEHGHKNRKCCFFYLPPILLG